MIYMTKIRQSRTRCSASLTVGRTVDGQPSCPPRRSANLLNSGFMLQQAEILAERIGRGRRFTRIQVQHAFQLLFDVIRCDELQCFIDFIRQHSLPDMCPPSTPANSCSFA
jgi:hypothetical protein